MAGAKNHALKLIPATVLSNQVSVIKNIPEIEDVMKMLELVEALGGKVKKLSTGTYQIDPSTIRKTTIPYELGRRLRTSVMFVAPLLARFGEAKIPHPGGCMIGKRPIDMFLDGFKALGAKITEEKNHYHLTAKSGLVGNRYVFRKISVTVTEAMVMAASLAKGKTELIFTACEPEITALAGYLNQRGARIKGAGTHNIEIEGVKSLAGGEMKCIPDRIECGTFAILGALLSDNLKITNCNPADLDVFWLYLEKAGACFKLGKNYVQIARRKGPLQAISDVTTHEYPGLVTDLQAPLTVLLTQAKGLSMVHETIFEGRLFYTDILNRMGANIILCDPHRVVINGPSRLYGKEIESPDLRAGIALVIAALIAKGKSEIANIYQIDRGYAKIEQRLRGIGADIKRIKE